MFQGVSRRFASFRGPSRRFFIFASLFVRGFITVPSPNCHFAFIRPGKNLARETMEARATAGGRRFGKWSEGRPYFPDGPRRVAARPK
jgi:hypothetical protein